MTFKEWEEYPRKDSQPVPAETGARGRYPILWSAEKFFLDDVLAAMKQESDEMRARLQEELAGLSNKVIACGGIDFAAEGKIREGVERVRKFMSLGLEILSGRDIGKAARIMKERWLETVFRFAAGRLFALRGELEKVVRVFWGGNAKKLFEFLDPPYEEIARGILREIPLCHDSAAPDNSGLRDFKSAADLERSEISVRQLAAIHEELQKKFPGFFTDKVSPKTQKAAESERLFSFLGTLLVNFVLNGKLLSRSLSVKDLSRFLAEGFVMTGKRRILNPRHKKDFLSYLGEPQNRPLMVSFWALVFENIEDELGHLPAAKVPDIRFISSVLIYQRAGGA
jgi:hypothetical protein